MPIVWAGDLPHQKDLGNMGEEGVKDRKRREEMEIGGKEEDRRRTLRERYRKQEVRSGKIEGEEGLKGPKPRTI